ncbi:MAG TPA: hypothetical protein VJG64_03265 [Candidatus Paceibacterota bacterium]
MYDYKIILGLIASIVGIIGYIPYYLDILRGTTKPHPFTWIGFALILGIAFLAQLSAGGGPGAWVNGVSVIGVLGIAILAFSKGERDITVFDWICFAGALVGILLWRLTNDPLSAVIIITIVDLIAFAPTWRKTYRKPHEETTSLYVLGELKYLISLFALASFNLTTALFPISIIITNALFIVILLLRRRQLAL